MMDSRRHPNRNQRLRRGLPVSHRLEMPARPREPFEDAENAMGHGCRSSPILRVTSCEEFPPVSQSKEDGNGHGEETKGILAILYG